MINLRTHIKRFGYLAIWLLILTACRPKGILSSKQMENILVDLHTAEGVMQVAGYNYGHDEDVRGYYLVILEEHGTTQAQFDSSLVWYTAHPTIIDKLYPKVIERLQEQYDTYAALIEKQGEGPRKSMEEWLNWCQKGYDKGSWEKKIEKNAQKFVYVEKML